MTLSSVCVICFHGGLSLLKSHGGAKIKFVGEAFNIVGDVGEIKNCGGAWKIVGELKIFMGEPFHGGCYRGVL